MNKILRQIAARNDPRREPPAINQLQVARALADVRILEDLYAGVSGWSPRIRGLSLEGA